MAARFLTALLVMLPSQVLAHPAPSGWVYPEDCCAGDGDCHHIPKSAVVRTSEGYLVQLREGMHHRYYKDADHLFPFTIALYGNTSAPNPNIRISGDWLWHLCLGGGVPNNGGAPSEYQWRCVYIQPEGVS